MIERNDEHGCYVLYDDFLKLQKQNDRLRQAYKCLEVLDRVIESSVCISLYKNESSHKAIKQALKEGAE
jgi:hypothetical protein